MTIAGSHAVAADRNGARLEEKRVKLRRAIRVRGGRWPEGTIRSATITREGGTWFLSAQFDGPPPKKVERPSPPGPADKPVLSRADYDDRFFRTLKEQLPWVRTFHSLEELQDALRAFRIWYTANWLIQRDGHRTPD